MDNLVSMEVASWCFCVFIAYPGRCPGLTAGCPLWGVLIRETLSLWAGVFEQE